MLAASLATLGAWAAWRVAPIRGPSLDERQARAAVRAGDMAAARAPLERWLAAAPGSPWAHLVKAEFALAGGDLAEVTRELNTARDLGCPLDALERVHALALTRLERFAESEPILARIRAGPNPPDPAVDEALARLYLRTYRLPEAEAVLKRWIDDAPDDGRPHLWMTEVDRRAGRTTLLEPHYRLALRHNPGLTRARLGLAELLRSQHRLDEAAREFQAALAANPSDVAALTGLGAVATERNELKTAAEHLDRALAIAPRDPKALKERALVDLRQGDPDAAVRRLDQAIAADPLDDEPLYQRILVYKRLGRVKEAEADARALERLRTDQAEAAALRERVTLNPSDDEARCAVAAWMFAHGRDDEGMVWARNVLERRPTHPGVNRVLADHYDREGEPGRANYHRLVAEAKP